MDFDKNKLRADFADWAVALRDAASVPVFMNQVGHANPTSAPANALTRQPANPLPCHLQWSVVHGVTADHGRFDFIVMHGLRPGTKWRATLSGEVP